MKKSDALDAILELWLELPPEKRRTTQDIALFKPSLDRDHPELLNFRSAGDKWQIIRIHLDKHLAP